MWPLQQHKDTRRRQQAAISAVRYNGSGFLPGSANRRHLTQGHRGTDATLLQWARARPELNAPPHQPLCPVRGAHSTGVQQQQRWQHKFRLDRYLPMALQPSHCIVTYTAPHCSVSQAGPCPTLQCAHCLDAQYRLFTSSQTTRTNSDTPLDAVTARATPLT